MTQIFNSESIYNPNDKIYPRESSNLTSNQELRDKSYELFSEIYPRSNGSDSFTTTGQSSRTSRKSELKSLRGERYMAKLCRSASNSPRIEYNSNSFLEYVRTKTKIEAKQKLRENNEGKSGSHVRNPSQDIEELESQWQAMKAQHNFESRENNSPYKFHFAPESPSVSKISSKNKDRVENNSIKKVNPIEKIQPVPSLLSKVIPQAKINLVQPSVRNQNRLGGSNHSKSVEPKQNVVPKEKPLNERNNKQNPLKTIYDKINIKKEDFEGAQIRKSHERLSETSIREKQSDPRSYHSKMTYSPMQSKTQTPGSNNTSLHSEARNTIRDFQTGNTIEYFAKNDNEYHETKTFNINLTQVPQKEQNIKKPVENNKLRGYFRSEEQERKSEKIPNRKSHHSPVPSNEMKTKILFYEANHKEEQESLFHAPATLEKTTQERASPSPQRINLNVIKSMKVNINNKQNTNNTNLITAFNPAEEKNENDIKENLKDYFDSIAEKIKLKLKVTKNSAEEKEKEDNEVQTQVKPPPNYSIQKPLHFVTKESNLSPMKKPSSEGPLASKLRKENQIKQEKKNPPQVPKQFYQINSKNMLKEKFDTPYSLEERPQHPNNSQPVHSYRLNCEPVALKTDFMSLESARLQRHKLISTNSSSKQSTLSESKNKEEHPLYLLTTQDDTGKDTSLERSKIKLKKTQTLESSKNPGIKKKSENDIKQKKSFESENITSKINEKILKTKEKSFKARK